MGKRNKVRYTSAPKSKVTITLSGNVSLQYRDDEKIDTTMKGDLLVYAECKQLHTNYFAQYDRTGFTGYFKVDVYDGNAWQPLIITDIFTSHENHFSRTEKPADTYAICEEILKALTGRTLLRTYREHYELEEVDEE